MQNYFIDNFTDQHPPGRAIGKPNPEGIMRKGIDREGVIGIDHEALRIKPLIKPGWARSCLSYGPYQRRNGLALGVLILNGHNTSHSCHIKEGLKNRLIRWALGHYTKKTAIIKRLWQWLFSNHKRYLFWHLKWWYNIRPGRELAGINENLIVGWFPNVVFPGLHEKGNYFAMHAALGDNGELWTRLDPGFLSAISGIQNIPVYYVIVLREKGAVYYISSLENVNGIPSFPLFRPLSIDPFDDQQQLYAGLSQSVLGQIGFRVDTRVYNIEVTQLTDHDHWYGVAHAADAFTGEGLLHHSPANRGGNWHTSLGSLQRTARGVIPRAENNFSILTPPAPPGLIHVLITRKSGCAGKTGLIWRYADVENYCEFSIAGDVCRLELIRQGKSHLLAEDDTLPLYSNRANSLQVLDSGNSCCLVVNGRLMQGRSFKLDGHKATRGCGIHITAPCEGVFLTCFEAYPRVIDLGSNFHFKKPWFRKGTRVIIKDSFPGQAMVPLEGNITTIGNKIWRKEYGQGKMYLTGTGAVKVSADKLHPNPGNTAYTIPWDNPGFADIQVQITPPGTDQGQGEKGRAGLIFWQSPRDFIMLSMFLDDSYQGASIALFSHLGGFEDIYDAVWSMVGRRIYWGKTHTLRVAFNGLYFIIFIDDEPVLYRSLQDVYKQYKGMSINRVGLAVNWEWGNDTGSTFKNFTGMI